MPDFVSSISISENPNSDSNAAQIHSCLQNASVWLKSWFLAKTQNCRGIADSKKKSKEGMPCHENDKKIERAISQGGLTFLVAPTITRWLLPDNLFF